MIVSVRYGFFSMAKFLFRPDRQKFVRWFMDQYTETIAKYANAATIVFIGHSNGTYLLASALENYQSRGYAASLLPDASYARATDGTSFLGNKQVEALRNYTGSHDAVVALFPRFFGPRMTRCMGNDVGSAGFNNFDIRPNSNFDEAVIPGGHSAFRDQVPQIVNYITSEQIPPPVFWVVWAGLLLFIGFPAFRVAVAGGQCAWVPLSVYLAVVVAILTRL